MNQQQQDAVDRLTTYAETLGGCGNPYRRSEFDLISDIFMVVELIEAMHPDIYRKQTDVQH